MWAPCIKIVITIIIILENNMIKSALQHEHKCKQTNKLINKLELKLLTYLLRVAIYAFIMHVIKKTYKVQLDLFRLSLKFLLAFFAT